MDDQYLSVWNLINTGGVIALLFVNLWLMIRGELLPRRVYEDLTKRILDELCKRVLDGVRTMLREEITRRRPGGD